jgi:hypothetical protein
MRPSSLALALPPLLALACGSAPPERPADGGRPPGDPDAAPPPDPPDAGPQTTRLRITNRCDEPIWIAHSDNLSGEQNVRLADGELHDYAIPDEGLASVRFWPKRGCDAEGRNCAIGDTGEGGGAPCGASGCQPPLDSKFEATFAALGSGAASWYNLSLVDGYTLPFGVVPKGAAAGMGTCVAADCSALSLAACPADEDLSGGGAHPAYASVDLRVPGGSGGPLACLSPCKKWSYPAPYGLGQPEGIDPGLHMCCPTPIDPATGDCTAANGCISPDACRDESDPLSVTRTSYVELIHAVCPAAYGYSYDDAQGLHDCPADTRFEVVFCP